MPTHYVSTYHLSWKISCPLSIKERQISWISWSSCEVMDICNQGHCMELHPAQAEFLQWDCAKGIDVLPKSIDLERTNKLRGLFVRFCNYDNRQRGNNRRGKLGLLFCCCCLFVFVVVFFVCSFDEDVGWSANSLSLIFDQLFTLTAAYLTVGSFHSSSVVHSTMQWFACRYCAFISTSQIRNLHSSSQCKMYIVLGHFKGVWFLKVFKGDSPNVG